MTHMTSTSRLPRAGALALAFACAWQPAHALETTLTAKYNARLSYLPINFATGKLTATLPESGRYSLDFGAQGIGFAMSGKAVGTVVPDGLSPVSSAIDTLDSSEKRSIRLALSRGRVRRDVVTPPVPYRRDRVPITDEHRVNVTDPISALVMPVSVKGAPLDAGNCKRTLRIFEGTERFNIQLSYLRTERVKTPVGYEGQAIVCRASYRAVAGHRAVQGVRDMEANQTMEAWLVPVEGSGMLVPWKISMGTKIGTMVIEASEFTARTVGTAQANVVDSFELRKSR